jgi:hypothetical protein
LIKTGNGTSQHTTHFLEVSLVVILFPRLDDLAEVVDEPQLPRVLLVDFLPNFAEERKNRSLVRARERPRVLKVGNTYVLRGELDAVM